MTKPSFSGRQRFTFSRLKYKISSLLSIRLTLVLITLGPPDELLDEVDDDDDELDSPVLSLGIGMVSDFLMLFCCCFLALGSVLGVSSVGVMRRGVRLAALKHSG